MMTSQSTTDQQEIVRIAAREGYGKIAEGASCGCCGPSSCCGLDTVDSAVMLAGAVGYEENDLSALSENHCGPSCDSIHTS